MFKKVLGGAVISVLLVSGNGMCSADEFSELISLIKSSDSVLGSDLGERTEAILQFEHKFFNPDTKFAWNEARTLVRRIDIKSTKEKLEKLKTTNVEKKSDIESTGLPQDKIESLLVKIKMVNIIMNIYTFWPANSEEASEGDAYTNLSEKYEALQKEINEFWTPLTDDYKKVLVRFIGNNVRVTKHELDAADYDSIPYAQLYPYKSYLKKANMMLVSLLSEKAREIAN